MKRNLNLFLSSLCLGFVSFLFFFCSFSDASSKSQNERGVARYWQSVGRHLNNAMTKYDHKR